MGIPIPKVTKTKTALSSSLVSVFEDSTTLLIVQEGRLFISFDSGVNWEKSNEIPVNIWGVELDEHYRNSRAVATAFSALYLTDDQGKHWRKLNLPKLYEGSYELDTHPFEKDYLLAHCVTCSGDDRATRGDSYVSNDGGKNFKVVQSPNTDYWHYWLRCRFACKSRDSIFRSNKDLVYGFDRGTGGHVFYTDDFGKSINPIDQFKDHTILDFRILDSHILVFTSGDRFNDWSTADLWVSNDGYTFNKAFLPAVLRDSEISGIIEDGLGRIIISTDSSYMKEEHESPIFISDSSGLQFHLLDVSTEGTLVSSSLKASKTLKGTMLVTVESTAKHGNEKNINSYSKISSDYGETWSNLRVIRSPDQPKDLFPCDVDDVGSCSLKLPSYLGVESSPNAAILMSVGDVGKDVFWGDKTMTFISRDGGRSWEVAFEYPCSWAFGDGGNIIVAIPASPFEDNVPKDEFYYSLDQGKTWKKYQLEVPVKPREVISTTLDNSGLSFIIRSFEEIYAVPSTEDFSFYTIDFAGVFNDRVCGSKDFEPWYLAGGECINGAKYSYNRRKQDSQCLVHKSSEDLSLREEACDQCTRTDYECSFGFIEDINGVCKPYPKAMAYNSECKDPNTTSVKLKSMNKLPGNKCVREKKIEPVEVPCDVARQISTAENKFKSKAQMYQFFDANKDESFSAAEDEVYISDDSG